MASMSLAFFSGGRVSYCFLCSAEFFFNTWSLWSGERDLRCFFSAAAFFLSNRSLSSGERDPHSCYVHQHQFVKFWSFSQEEDPRIVVCVLQHHCIKFEFFSLVRVIVDSFDVQWHPLLESVLSYRERESLNIASPLQNSFSHFVGRNIQHAFWFEPEFEC